MHPNKFGGGGGGGGGGSLKVVLSRNERMSSLKEKNLLVCALWVNLSFKCPINYPMPKPYIISLKDLFDLKGGELPKLVENDMTNKPMRPYHSKETTILL